MRTSKLSLIAGLPLVLGARATAIPGAYTEPKAGFANVASQITPAIGKRTVFAETQAENEALKKQVQGMCIARQSLRICMVRRNSLSSTEEQRLKSRRFRLAVSDLGVMWERTMNGVPRKSGHH